MFRADPAELRPRLCPACGTLVGATAPRCHECGASMTFSLAAASRALSRLLPGKSPVTYFVLFLNSLLFALSLAVTLRISESPGLMTGISGFVLDRLGACRPDLFQRSEFWRLVMPIFLHGSLLHFGMNTIILMDLGPQVEEVYGSARYLFLYVSTGIAGFLVSAWWGNFSIGASGALLGLIGLMLAITTRRGGRMAEMIRAQLVRWIVYIFILGFLIGGIDNAAHLGGLLAGFLLGKRMADREPMNATERKRAYALGWSAGVIVAASFAMMLVQYFRA